jgi:hypothetical protein
MQNAQAFILSLGWLKMKRKSPGNLTSRAIQCVLLFSNSRVFTGDVSDSGGFVYYVTGYT